MVEKGSEVGAHILSGAVIDPIGLDALLPDWRNEDTFVKTAVTDDRFYVLGPSGALRLPNLLLPPLLSNHGNFIVSLGDVCRYLAKKAEALGVEIYPGFAAAEVLYENDAVAGIATGDMGVGKDGHHKPGFARGMELRGKYTVFAEGARGSLTKALIARYGLGATQRAAEIRPRAQGTLAGHPRQTPARPRPAHRRLAARQRHRRRLVHLSLRRQSGGGGLRRASELHQPVSVAVRGIPALQDASARARHLRGRQAAVLRRARHRRRRLAVGAARRVSGRRTRRLRRGLSQRAAHQGQPQRRAVRHARRRAHRRSARRRPRQRRTCGLRSGVAKLSHRPRSAAGAQRQAAVVEIRHAHGLRARRPRHVDQHHRPVAVRHAAPRQARLRHAQAGRGLQADRVPQARRQAHLRPAVVGVSVQHQPRRGPAGALVGARSRVAEILRARRLCRPVGALLPGRRLRMGRGGGRSRALSSTRRTASTAKPATSRIPTRTSPGCRPKAAAARTIRTCEGYLSPRAGRA